MSYSHDHAEEVTYFAKTNFRNAMTKFGIKTDDRRRHLYVIGKTGMGKTVLLENLILSDIYAGHGCCYVDPHGDTAEKIIDYIPSWRLNDVVYFNPADLDFPVGFNILEAVDERHKHLVASGMMGVFAKIWEGMWSSRMEYILNNTILALLDNPGQTLLGINRMMSDVEFRKRMVGNIKDPVVKQFWVKEFASWSEKYATEATAAIQNKIGQFLSAAVVRNVVAQVKSTIDIRAIMDTNKIFIINLSKGRIGEDNSRLLGGLLITKIQLSAMERVDTPEEERDDFYLYVDEFQNFAVESFAGILSEARKYRLCLTMAHQYIAQLTEEVRDAVFGNVGTIISFRVGAPDAVFMEAEFMPRFTPEDIINLPKYNIYIKLLIDGVTSQPFSAITLPPIAQVTNSEEKVIKISRERYARPRAEIEEKVLEWSGLANKDVDELYKEAEVKKKAAKESRKPRHEYNCTRCDKDIVLPVELDRSRPIYCDDCIELVRDERKNKKRGGKKPSYASKSPPKKPASPPPPKPSEGTIVESSVPEEPSISLEELKKKDEGPASETAPVEKPQAPTQETPSVPKPKIETPKVEPPKSNPEPVVVKEQPKVEEKKEVAKSEPRPEQKQESIVKSEPEKVVEEKKPEEVPKREEQKTKQETTSKPPESFSTPSKPRETGTDERPKKKRKRRRKKRDSVGSQNSQAAGGESQKSQPHQRAEPTPKPEPSAQKQETPRTDFQSPPPTGSIKAGQSVRFD